MVVVRVKRVWDGAVWHEAEFLCAAPAMDATTETLCRAVCAVFGAHAAVGRVRALLAGRALPPQAQEMVARTLAAAEQLLGAQQVAQGVCVAPADMQDALRSAQMLGTDAAMPAVAAGRPSTVAVTARTAHAGTRHWRRAAAREWDADAGAHTRVVAIKTLTVGGVRVQVLGVVTGEEY